MLTPAAQTSFTWLELVPSVPANVNRARLVLNPEAQEGLRPSRECAERLLWAKYDRLSELLSAVHRGIAHRAHYEFALLENPSLVAQMEADYLHACKWEQGRYGNVYATFNRKVGVIQ